MDESRAAFVPNLTGQMLSDSGALKGPEAPSASSEVADAVNHPSHYTSHPSGIECIDVVEHMGFNVGNAIKYLWRCDLKGNDIEDIRKAAWYVQREIERRLKAAGGHDGK